MENDFAFTKSNLIAAQNSLELALAGFELLDKKRNVLVINMMSYIERAEEIQNKIWNMFEEAYDALKVANITIGINTVAKISDSIPEAHGFNIINRSTMGVPIPKIEFERKNIGQYYSFYRTNPALDVALKRFQELKYLVYELSEVEDSVYKLAVEIKRTAKRANALQNIQIPKYKQIVKTITEVLEEKEREDFFRLKVVKKKIG